jgi:hypothetical protein
VEDQPEGRGKVCRQQDGIALEVQPVWIVGEVRGELLARELAEIGALPIRADQQGVRGRERRQAAFEAFDELLRRFAAAQRVARNRLNDGKRVADAVCQFADEQPQPAFRRAGGGDVTGAFEDEAAAVEGFELQAAFNDQILAGLRPLPQFAGPAAIAQQFLLQRGE